MKKAFVLIMLLILIFAVSGCGDTKDTKTGLEAGFILGSGMQPPYQCAYRSNKNEFDLNDVTLEFFYGSSSKQDKTLQFFFAKGVDSSYIQDLRTHDYTADANLFFIKEISDFDNDLYRFTYSEKDIKQGCKTRQVVEINYGFSEHLTIPIEMFIEESNYLSFFMIEKIYETEGATARQSGAIHIYYKIEGEKVLLSDKAIN